MTTAAPDPEAELNALQDQLCAAAEVLRKQAELLRLRQIEPPPALLPTVEAARSGLDDLARVSSNTTGELSQLRALGITSALINSSLNVDTVLEQALDGMLALTGAERGFIVQKETGTGELQFRIARGLNTSDLTGEDVSRTLLNEVLNTGKSTLTDNAAIDPRLAASDTLARFPLRSIMCAPLVTRGVVEGAIYIDNRLKAGVFEDSDLALLTAFAHQAAIALHNARLFTRVQATTAEISQARALIENVFASIGSGIVTTDEQGRILTLNAAAGTILRADPQTAPGRPLADVLPLGPDLLAQLDQLRQSGRSVWFEAQPEIAGRGRLALAIRVSLLTAADGRAQGTVLVLDDLTEQQEREETLRLMTRYLPPGMVERIDQIADLALGGERREVTCAFFTVCSISQFPPGLRPAEAMARLNQYLDTATTCVHKAGGIIDKYMGSSLMVLFNTQLNPNAGHAHAAVNMALDLRAALNGLCERMATDPAQPQYTLGIHSGVATLGNVGSLRRRSFTALGDTINLAKRVQESARDGQLLVTGATVGRLPSPLAGVRLESRPALVARGRQQPTEIFEILPLR